MGSPKFEFIKAIEDLAESHPGRRSEILKAISGAGFATIRPDPSLVHVTFERREGETAIGAAIRVMERVLAESFTVDEIGGVLQASRRLEQVTAGLSREDEKHVRRIFFDLQFDLAKRG